MSIDVNTFAADPEAWGAVETLTAEALTVLVAKADHLTSVHEDELFWEVLEIANDAGFYCPTEERFDDGSTFRGYVSQETIESVIKAVAR